MTKHAYLDDATEQTGLHRHAMVTRLVYYSQSGNVNKV